MLELVDGLEYGMQGIGPGTMTAHRVLIVDDYPDAADITCALLSMLGHTCRSASNGKDAIAAAREFHPDIAILDIGLPDISGYEVATALRKSAERPLYLAALTGWGQPADRVRALEAGFDHHVLKPADTEKLRAIIHLAERAT